jgi:hypothetical protein
MSTVPMIIEGLASLQAPCSSTLNHVNVHLACELACIEPHNHVHARSCVGGESQQVHAIPVDQSVHEGRVP